MLFVPFVLETHGAIGEEAKAFVRLLSKNATVTARVQAEGSSLLSFRAAGSSSMVEIIGPGALLVPVPVPF